jgi:phage-related protein
VLSIAAACRPISSTIEPLIGARARSVHTPVDLVAATIECAVCAIATPVELLIATFTGAFESIRGSLVTRRVGAIGCAIVAVFDSITAVVEPVIDCVTAIIETLLDSVTAVVAAFFDAVTASIEALAARWRIVICAGIDLLGQYRRRQQRDGCTDRENSLVHCSLLMGVSTE